MPAVHIRIDDATHKKLRIRAIEERISMQCLVTESIIAKLQTPLIPMTAEEILARKQKRTSGA